jgi:hypothetical protein
VLDAKVFVQNGRKQYIRVYKKGGNTSKTDKKADLVIGV